MAYTGLTIDSTTNFVDFINTSQDSLTATIAGEALCLHGNARIQGSITITKSNIFIATDARAFNGGQRGQTAVITYTPDNTVTGTTPATRVQSGSSILIETIGRSNQVGLILSEISDSLISESGNRVALIYTQPESILRNARIEGIKWLEIAGAFSVFAGVVLIDTESGILNYEAGRLDLIGLNIPSTSSGYSSAIGDGNSGNNINYYWNTVSLNLATLIFLSANNKIYNGFTATWKFEDLNGNIENALLIYRDNRGGSTVELARYTTNSSGVLVGTYNSKTGATGSSIARPTLWIVTSQSALTGGTFTHGYGPLNFVPQARTYTVDAVTFSCEVRSYLHLAPDTIAEITEEIGKINADESVNFYRNFLLIVDEGVTETNTTTVGAYSGITNATALITLSGTLTLSQVYDSRKLYWRNNDSIAVPTKDGVAADFGTAAITISAPANLPATTVKYTHFATTGIITLSAAGNYSGGAAGAIPATGEVQVSDGTSNLAGWAFASGAEVNLRSGQTAATVQVDQPQIANITPGAGVTLVSAPVLFEGFPTGNNANGVAFAAVIAILNTDDDVLLAEYTGGATYSVSLSEVGNGVGPFEVWGDGVGLRRTIAQTITATRTDPVSLAGLFEEFRSEDGTALIGLAAADSDVVYVALDTNFEFDGPTHSFLGIVHQFDLLTSTPAGQDFDNAAVRGIEFVSNDAYRRIFLPAPFTISASATAVGIPMITDCLILRTTTLADVRVTPIVQFAFQAEGAGGGLDAAGVRAAVGLAAANLDTQLGAIDTVVDAILVDTDVTIPAQITARTLESAAYFDPATDTVANVTTVATTTNITNLPAIPTNWITAAGIATDAIGADELAAGAVTEIQSGLATSAALTTLTNTVGTAGAGLTNIPTIANVTTVATTTNLTNLPSIPANWITAAGINAGAFTSAKFASGAFDAVWTVTTRTLTAIADSAGITTLLGRIGSALTITGGAVTVGTNNDKTGYSLSQAFPSNFASLGINSSGHVSRVTLVDTTTTNADMRGTDSALLAANYTSPANSDITAIKAKTDQFVFTVANQVDANALSGSGGGLDAAGVRAAVGLASANLDTQLSAIDTVVDGIAVQTTRVDGLIENSSGNRFTAKALEEGPAGGSGGDATAANQTTIINALAVVDTVVDAILVDTAEIGAAGAGLTAIPTIANVTTVGTVTNAVTTTVTPLDATATQNAAAAALTAYDPPTRAELTSDIGTVTTAISDVPTNAEFDARTLPAADYFVVGDYTAPANSDITAIKTKTDQFSFTIANQVDSNALSGAAGGGDDAATIYTYFTSSSRQDTFRADISSLLTSSAYTASLPANFADLNIAPTTGFVTSTNAGSGATAQQVWEYAGGDRALSGAQATAITSAATLAQVNAAGFTTDRNNALTAMAKQLGLVAGVTATHDPDGITVSDGDGSTVITDNLDGSYTVSKAP